MVFGWALGSGINGATGSAHRAHSSASLYVRYDCGSCQLERKQPIVRALPLGAAVCLFYGRSLPFFDLFNSGTRHIPPTYTAQPHVAVALPVKVTYATVSCRQVTAEPPIVIAPALRSILPVISTAILSCIAYDSTYPLLVDT